MLRAARPVLNTFKGPVGHRGFAKATLIGRVGAVPEVRKTSSGKEYVTYSLAVSKPPKKDEQGQLVIDENGFPVRETNWYTVFAFGKTAPEYLPKIEPGSQLYVEANIEKRNITNEEGAVVSSELILHETSHKLLAKKKSA